MKRFLGNAGQATVEFAIGSLIFFTFSFILTDAIRLAYAQSSMQWIVNQSVREGVFGRSGGVDDTREAYVEEQVMGRIGKFGIGDVDISILDQHSNAGSLGPSQFFMLKAEARVQLSPPSAALKKLMGDSSGTYTIQAQQMMRTEPFDVG